MATCQILPKIIVFGSLVTPGKQLCEENGELLLSLEIFCSAWQSLGGSSTGFKHGPLLFQPRFFLDASVLGVGRLQHLKYYLVYVGFSLNLHSSKNWIPLSASCWQRAAVFMSPAIETRSWKRMPQKQLRSAVSEEQSLLQPQLSATEMIPLEGQTRNL